MKGESLGKHVSDLFGCIDRVDLDESLAQVLAEMMVFYSNVLGSGSHFGCDCELNSFIVIFKDGTLDSRLGHRDVQGFSNVL